MGFYKPVDFRQPFLKNLPQNKLLLQEAVEIDPDAQKILLWNNQIYEYDFLFLANGKNLLGFDFDARDAQFDLDQYQIDKNYESGINENLTEEQKQIHNQKNQQIGEFILKFLRFISNNELHI